jgi:hypothetical protein
MPAKLRLKRRQKTTEPAPKRKNKERTKPVSKGTVFGDIHPVELPFPPSGKISRYILTSAQNNTEVHEKTWENIKALAAYYNAEIYVGTFSYDISAYGKKAVKEGTHEEDADKEVTFDARIEPYIKDEHIQLGKGLVWCGKTNIMPTASNPLSGFETFAGRNSAIFPHVKTAMRSIASLQGSGAKLIYTTGTVTKRHYIQKKAGIVAEFHHNYGGLIVEVDVNGIWKVRQLDAEDETGTIYDLTLKVEDGKVYPGQRVEAITWGDIHATCIDPTVLQLSATSRNNMLDVLKPKYQFIHDLIEGASVNHHDARKPLERFKTAIRGLSVVHEELIRSAGVLSLYHRKDSHMVVVNSNHDRWLDRWLDSFDPRFDDARNAEIYYDGNAARYKSARLGIQLIVLEYLLREHAGLSIPVQFLQMDESFLICDKRIECGQHGDLGPNGTPGSALALSKVGRRANTCHTHTAGIYDGLYVAGTSTDFRMGYNHGPSSWTHSHIVTYPNGKRAIITMFEGAWRAE